MTQKDGSPEASEGPYWSEELLAVLVVGLGDETQARETLEGIIQQALSGRALQGISEEALASYLSKLYERIAESVQDSNVARRKSGRAGDERPDHKPTTEDAMATTSFFLEAIARPSSRKGVTEDDIGWMGPFLQVGGVPGRRL